MGLGAAPMMTTHLKYVLAALLVVAWAGTSLAGEPGDPPAPEPTKQAEPDKTPEAEPDKKPGKTPEAEPDKNEPEAKPEPEPEEKQPEAKPAKKRPAHARPLFQLRLPGGFGIHGRFDVAYERRGYTTDPTKGTDAIRNFHRFVFLSRHSPHDPFFFNAEIITLSFFEAGVRLQEETWTFQAKLGKLMVPFGEDPLYHHYYGGLGAFDQQMLPAVWASYGVNTSFDYRIKPFNITLHFDLYAMVGYALDDPDGIVDLRTDLSSLDENVRPAFGGRVRAAWGPLKLTYSVMANPLGFDRNMVLQAVDFTVWRIPDVPFVEDLALTMGLMRADVSGGTERDYYHFANYLQLRYYPIDWIYLQYRTGINTVDNRMGAWKDERRLDDSDFSTHSLAIGARYRGFSIVLQHIWRLEDAIELDNDFLRLTVAYEF